jgi:hypothetical protein
MTIVANTWTKLADSTAKRMRKTLPINHINGIKNRTSQVVRFFDS